MTVRQRHVILFVRAPRVGTVKRRLAADIGAGPAWAFYRRNVRDVAWRLARDPRWRLWLGVTPGGFDGREPSWPPGLTCIAQGRGDLGQRMQRCLRALPSGPAVLIGGDIPGVTAPVVWRAFQAFAGHDAVFGPAVDGGYWLVGLERRLLAGQPFKDVPWSGPDALAGTLANLPGSARVAYADTLADVDTGADMYGGRIISRR